jgi:hypothetical protein
MIERKLGIDRFRKATFNNSQDSVVASTQSPADVKEVQLI